MQELYEQDYAAAIMMGDAEHPGLRGSVKFLPCDLGTLVIADIRGLPDSDTGFFGLHIHEGAACQGQGFSDTGGHYDPVGTRHPLHAGDLPPLLSCGGKAHLTVATDRFHIRDIIGRTMVIHSHPDDFRTQPSGDSGSKIACGEIRRI